MLQYDAEWLAIVKATHHLITTQNSNVQLPQQAPRVTQAEIDSLRSRMQAIPTDFEPSPLQSQKQAGLQGNFQTDRLLDALGLQHVCTVSCSTLTAGQVERLQEQVNEMQRERGNAPSDIVFECFDENEIDIDD